MSTSQRFRGRVAVVTGTTSRIGRGIAETLQCEGARVFGLDVAPGRIGEYVHCDVRTVDSVRAAAANVLAATDGRIDHVVANAGIRGSDTPAEDLDPVEFDDVLAVILRGVFLSIQAFAKPMLTAGSGSIVAIASMSGTRVVNVPQRTVHYNTAKAGVTALVRLLAAEWGGRGVRVNTLSPGFVATPFLDGDVSLHEQWLAGTDLLIDGGYSLR
ncbi:SDR family NAD(P)-dependent oxidoreductase [Glaciibacter psychrotolerans]|uniref:NAD(P)-dependent dehydrogenase (Short-subunit alcohol dehydrogenase family) n=1 Tax=Glaciibacter psychrotolerans TaxID=670054 RepID=A0A7Z0EF23_9MICO|nr:SDR family oxidoreductase [Leifsonia psychrotolerans]NYJ20355.1 NAD(P)-dependent dehydrogenase (short-subunit alcohol dehydrogenase family) [Leifsonia psychrotolerans]